MIWNAENFYHGLITKYVALFGNMFNTIVIKRFEDDGVTVSQTIKVPLSFGPKEKMLVRLTADPDLNRPAAAVLPQISFEIAPGGYVYDPDRKFGSIQKKVTKIDGDKNKLNVLYAAVPYDIMFNLYVYAKNIEDANKIMEQIIPFFTPDYTMTVELVPEMDEIRDIPITIESVSCEDVYDKDYKERRTLIWTIQFRMKAWFFGPVKKKPIIKFVTINQRLQNEATNPSLTNANPIAIASTLQPGLTANGEPTSNISETISYLEIAVDDNWGYVVDFDTFTGT
jgi:hypothetical protein